MTVRLLWGLFTAAFVATVYICSKRSAAPLGKGRDGDSWSGPRQPSLRQMLNNLQVLRN
jgi:hypothetical protein